MLWLLLASIIWAFSFGLIKGLISGLDPFVMGMIRMAFAFALSLFFLKPRAVVFQKQWQLAFAGAIQLGLMYAPYLLSFRYLKAHEVALFTMTTPILVVAVHQIAERIFSWRIIAASTLSIIGGVVVAYKGIDNQSLDMFYGIILVQLANLLFAVGQFVYAKAAPVAVLDQIRTAPYYFGGAFVGATVVSVIAILNGAPMRSLTPTEWGVLAWLGIVASGLGFAVWNFGVSRVSYGALAVASDFKLPIAVVVSIVVFGESANAVRLGLGILILAAATMMVRRPRRQQ